MPPKRIKPKVTAVGMTDPGSRTHNEDGFLSIQGTYQHIFAVCDGMGGHAAGEVASSMAVETLKKAFLADRDLAATSGEFLSRAISDANYTIFRDGQAHPERSGMGSTCVVGLVRGTKLSVGHVGDSRAYLIRGGGIRQLTRDHSFVEEMVKAGMITPHEAHSNPQRNVILQSLGRGDGVNVDVAEDSVTLRVGDYVLLCSDGLTAVVADQEIAETIERLGEPRLVAEELIELTNRRGGPDNVTVVCVRYDGVVSEGPPIAVICDEVNSNDLYRLVLQRDGYSVDVYSPTNAVLDLHIGPPPKLIVVEHNDDPDFALEICAQLKATHEFTRVPVLLVCDDITEQDALAVGARHLTSRQLLTDLVPTVRQLIESVSPRIYALDPSGNQTVEVDTLLRSDGYVVTRKPTLDALLDKLKAMPADMLLLHVVEDVEYVCASLRERGGACPIVLTAEGAVHDAREAYAVGADYYLTRPRDIASLARMLLQKPS